MKKDLIELVFRVTETCNNGKERTFKKSVFATPFYKDGDKTLYNQLGHCVPLAIKALEEQHYYHIELVDRIARTIIFTDDVEENF